MIKETVMLNQKRTDDLEHHATAQGLGKGISLPETDEMLFTLYTTLEIAIDHSGYYISMCWTKVF